MSRVSSASDPLSDDLRELCALTSPLGSAPAKTGAKAATSFGDICSLAERHGLRPLLARARERDVSDSPRLRQETLAIAAHNLRCSQVLLEVANAFALKGIRVLGYKGPALASLLYRDVSMREFVDLDVLVPWEDIPAAEDALLHLGYRADLQLTARQERDLRKHSSTLTFTSPEGIPFELQWQVAHRSTGVRFQFDDLWDRRIAVPLSPGHSISTFSVNDQLLVLSLHGARHFWESLCWVADIAYLLQQPALDLDWVWIEARRRKLSNFVALALQLAHDCFGTPRFDLPREVSITAVARAADLSDRRINALTVEPEFTNAEHVAFAGLLTSRRARSSYFLSLAFTPGPDEWRAARLSPRFHFLYPAIRLARLVPRLFRRSVPRFAK